MTAFLINHLWQSTLFAAAIAVVALAVRRNGAHVRYWLWFAASVKFFVPFALLMSAGGAIARSEAAGRTLSDAIRPAISAFSVTVDQVTQPFDGVFLPTSAPMAATGWTPWLVAIWAAGFATIVVVRLRGWMKVRAAVRASTPGTIASVRVPAAIRVRTTSAGLEPGVVGVWRPILLMPAGLERHLSPRQLDAVIAHELCHVRRRDNATAAIHMAVEAACWFHPLVWWISARLLDERERACDEAVLALGAEPDDYAAGILNVCKRCVESPLACVSGVTGSNLRRRLDAIMFSGVGLRLNVAKRILLTIAAVAAIALPIAAGMLTAPLRAVATVAQTAPSQMFDVASVKPCEEQPVPPRGRSGGGSGSFSPGRAHFSCFVVRNLINMAYISNRGPARDASDPIYNWPGLLGAGAPDGPQQIRGGPAWVYADKYTIEAKTPGTPGVEPPGPGSPERAAMTGPMLRSLLEDRFKLRLHRELEDAPMLGLVVSKTGLKIKPMPEGGCTKDRSNGPILLSDAARRGVKPTCGTVNGGPHDGNWRYEHGGQDLAVVANVLSRDLGIKVLDRTGVTDIFNISWEYAPDESTPGALRWLERYGPQPPVRATAATIFKALEEQLGLKLEPVKGQRGYLVIDHIERPVPDAPSMPPDPPARARGAGR